MTDNEIIKDLECRIDNFSKLVLNLINRKNAEIKQWKEEANRWQNAWCEAINDIEKTKSEAIKDFAERINPIIEQLIEIMFNGNQNKCMIKNCHKYSSVPCESPICIDENKAFWKLMIYNIVKQLEENK